MPLGKPIIWYGYAFLSTHFRTNALTRGAAGPPLRRGYQLADRGACVLDTGLEHQDSIAPAGLTHAESASLELGVEPEGSPPCDGLDTWLANCNPQLRAAAGSPVSRRRLEELWHAAMETASLRMRLQAYESSSPESSCPAVESEEAGGACGGYPSGTAAKVLHPPPRPRLFIGFSHIPEGMRWLMNTIRRIDWSDGLAQVDAEGQAHRREETIRAELAGLQRRLGTLRAASEAALTAAEGLSGCYPRRPEPPSGNVSSRNQVPMHARVRCCICSTKLLLSSTTRSVAGKVCEFHAPDKQARVDL